MAKAAKGKPVSASVQADDLVDLRKYSAATKIMEVKASQVDFVIQFDKGNEIKAKAAEMAVKPVMRLIRKQINDHIDAAVPKILEQHEFDQSDTKGAFSKAESLLKSLNDNLEDIFEKDMAKKAKKAVADAFGCSTNELKTIGSIDFKKLSFIRGAFKGEMTYETAALPDLGDALTKKGWQFCGVAWSGKKAAVGVDNKKELNTSALKELKSLVGATKALAGRIKADSQTNVAFRFIKGDKPPTKKILMDALGEQSGKKMSNVDIEEVTQFESVKVEKPDEKEKTGEKGGAGAKGKTGGKPDTPS